MVFSAESSSRNIPIRFLLFQIWLVLDKWENNETSESSLLWNWRLTISTKNNFAWNGKKVKKKNKSNSLVGTYQNTLIVS